MSKSILVLDTQNSCRKCKLRYDSYVQCKVCVLADDIIEYFYETDTKPEWCPLSPLPDEKDIDWSASDYEDGRVIGWNECLDEILGGEENVQ